MTRVVYTVDGLEMVISIRRIRTYKRVHISVGIRILIDDYFDETLLA